MKKQRSNRSSFRIPTTEGVEEHRHSENLKIKDIPNVTFLFILLGTTRLIFLS